MKKVTSTGPGIAGLSAGCYVQMNSYGIEIFERAKTLKFI